MMTPRPFSISVAIGLLFVQALFWAGFALIVALGVHPGLPDNPFYRVLMAVLAAFCGALLVFLAIRLARPEKRAWYAAVIFLGGISVLTFTDDVGLADLLFLFLPLIPLILLGIHRRWYFHPGKAPVIDRPA
jgi:lysylphosphatidylglycerol synthetase-like protein (DUF2156 family)